MAEYFAGGHLRFVNGEWRDDDGNLIEIACVRHGRWEVNELGYMVCTHCGWVRYGIPLVEYYPYCPNCGAKIDEELKEGAGEE